MKQVLVKFGKKGRTCHFKWLDNSKLSCSGDMKGFWASFSCLLREDNILHDVGERIEPSCSQRPGFRSLPLPRQRFEEINTLASALIQAED